MLPLPISRSIFTSVPALSHFNLFLQIQLEAFKWGRIHSGAITRKERNFQCMPTEIFMWANISVISELLNKYEIYWLKLIHLEVEAKVAKVLRKRLNNLPTLFPLVNHRTSIELSINIHVVKYFSLNFLTGKQP